MTNFANCLCQIGGQDFLGCFSATNWQTVQTATFDENFSSWFQIGQGYRISGR
jgi:hypothetical protein